MTNITTLILGSATPGMGHPLPEWAIHLQGIIGDEGRWNYILARPGAISRADWDEFLDCFDDACEFPLYSGFIRKRTEKDGTILAMLSTLDFATKRAVPVTSVAIEVPWASLVEALTGALDDAKNLGLQFVADDSCQKLDH